MVRSAYVYSTSFANGSSFHCLSEEQFNCLLSNWKNLLRKRRRCFNGVCIHIVFLFHELDFYYNSYKIAFQFVFLYVKLINRGYDHVLSIGGVIRSNLNMCLPYSYSPKFPRHFKMSLINEI